MRTHIIGYLLSRSGGGIFSVLNELYNNKLFFNSPYSNLLFWGYRDSFSENDMKNLPGKKYIFDIPFKKLNKIYYSSLFKKKFLAEIEENEIIHIHSLWLYSSMLARIAQTQKKAKKIISVHGMLDTWALQNGNFKKHIALKLFEKHNINTADCLHALCEQEYYDIRTIAPHTPIAIIPME